MLKDPKQLELLKRKKKGNKFRATRVKLCGYTFDSKAEAARFIQLQVHQKNGHIVELEVHPRFYFANGKRYIADFRYRYDVHFKNCVVESAPVIEDVKSPITRTALYLFKKAQMKSEFNINIQEIEIDPTTADTLIKAFLGERNGNRQA